MVVWSIKHGYFKLDSVAKVMLIGKFYNVYFTIYEMSDPDLNVHLLITIQVYYQYHYVYWTATKLV